MPGIAVVRTVTELRAAVAGWRRAVECVALVPTMGALHDGHLELVRQGQRLARRVIVSIFVNPTQFAPTEDLDKYPRTFEADCRMLSEVGADLVWAPTKSEMYPDGFATSIAPSGAAAGLESITRPHFFGGVATVCCKLFTQAGPDFAMFGEKDYQQLAVIRQMVRDLNLPLAIVGVPTVREPDGLAMSSRNRYLTAGERPIAVEIHRTITAAADAVARGADATAAETAATGRLLAAGFRQVDYVAVRDAASLQPVAAKALRGPRRVLAAAWLGGTRLIDNVPVPSA